MSQVLKPQMALVSLYCLDKIPSKGTQQCDQQKVKELNIIKVFDPDPFMK